MSTVCFGKNERFRFTAAGTLSSWTPQVVPAVYALTYKQDPSMRPKAHTVLYFGQSDDMSQQLPALNDNICDWWVSRGGHLEGVYVFIHPMVNSTRWERARVYSQLVSEYNPQGNF